MSIVAPRQWTKIVIDGHSYLRLPLHTRWLEDGDDLAAVLLDFATGRETGDTVVISEKVALLLEGHSVPMDSIHTGWQARLLARFVRPRTESRGLSIPEKMQYVLDTVGRPRVWLAAAVTAATRPFRVRGLFYRIAGSLARDIDGGRPPYEDRLFPPFEVGDATRLCDRLERLLDTGVAIVDINDFGGSIRAVSTRSLPAATLSAVLADNPLRQRLTGTPFAIIRPT
ncbi:hypothetical protein [Actinopolymorpha alba]|uniref:hypothetical protein n=1 Tax=Actinopolymorpha alba TaxID=533267 RepID=UPI001ED9A90A|nr:hypothetical protein [Actinopolymorpha alba]